MNQSLSEKAEREFCMISSSGTGEVSFRLKIGSRIWLCDFVLEFLCLVFDFLKLLAS